MRKTVADMGEFPLIDRVMKKMPLTASVIMGAGDDCAVIARDARWYELLTTDMVIENVHFTRPAATPAHIGYKALARSVSDIAAMGGLPQYALITITLPPRLPVTDVDGIYRGIRTCASLFDIAVVGGDTAAAAILTISTTVIGRVERTRIMTRRGARAGDILFVTGTLGGAQRKKHLTFMPRVHEARFVRSIAPVTAMIDISDGLLQDAGHILTKSAVGCRIDLDRIPLAPDVMRYNKTAALRHALSDGEDFELLFTVPARYRAVVEQAWQRTYHIPLSAIGTITRSRRCVLESGGKEQRMFTKKGYVHF